MTNNSKFVVPTYNKIAQIYTEKYFNDDSDTPFVDKFLSYLPNRASILDIGCGPGNFTQYILEKGFDVEGIDLTKEMIKIAQQKVPCGKFQVMDMRHLIYDDNTFDGLLVAYSLIHIPSEEIDDTLKGFNSKLKSGGIVGIITQVGKPDTVVDEPLRGGTKIFINFFTPGRLSNFLTNSGFEIVYQEELPTEDPDSLSNKVIYTIARKSGIINNLI